LVTLTAPEYIKLKKASAVFNNGHKEVFSNPFNDNRWVASADIQNIGDSDTVKIYFVKENGSIELITKSL